MRKFITAYNEDLLSFVPEQGTVGACGDLAPLAHLALGLMGEGLMWDMESKSYKPAGEVLKSNYYLEKNFEPMKLMPKEGLTLINGAQMISSLTTEALLRAENAVKTGDIIAALTLEALKGTVKATHPSIHIARPHPGQILSASTMRKVLIHNGVCSELNQSHCGCGRVQDSYSLRCVPQVHGIVHDTLKFIRKRLTTELNSATDNPMIFPDQEDKVISGGNFHGEYPAKLADYLAIAIHEVASLSETRVQRLMNTHSSHLPAFLIGSSGLNSGLMISHCTAAALVSENKGLCHPASVDSIPTSAGQEDHVSMGGWAARKALKVVENVERCLAIELLSACQALDLLKPLKTTDLLEMVHSLVRVHVPFLEQDSILSEYIEKLTDLIRSGAVYSIVNA
jgi:histidine ammonia-lyase